MNFENTLNKYKQKLIYHDLNRHIKPIRNSYQYFIVIPVLNELEYLFKTLNSINNQDSLVLNKTLIVISHKLKPLKICDEIKLSNT